MDISFQTASRVSISWLVLGASFAPAFSPAAKAAPAPVAVSPTDPERFIKIPEWNGSFRTGTQNSGERKQSISTVTWSDSITVEGRFKLAPYKDPRNPATTLRGKGEAHIRVSGKRKAVSSLEVVDTTAVGDYVDTFNVEVSHIDTAKGTYQLSIVRDLWQQQPHKGKAYEQTTITTNAYGSRTRVDLVPGHSWADDAGAGFGPLTPLPKTGFLMKGMITSNNGDLFSTEGSHWHTAWTIEPADPEFQEPLKAVAGGPYVLERGQTINLDGWKSTGKIRSFKWSFAPVDPNGAIPFNAGSTKEGRRVPATLLAPVKATLTVSDGTKEDSDSVVVEVQARDFKTPFNHREKEKLHPRSIPPRRVLNYNITYVGGENVCALCAYGPEEAIHVLHPAPVNHLWDKVGYELKQVQDPGGPFDGDWFVNTYLARIDREIMINKYILPGGPPPVRTAKPFYETNQALGHDVVAYLAAVRKHERLHSQYMQESLALHDPGPKIEALAAKEEAAVRQQADQTLQTAADVLEKDSSDPLPSIGFRQTMAFPDDATDEYVDVEMAL